MAAFPAIGVEVWMFLGIGLAVVVALSALSGNRIVCAVSTFITGIGPWWDGFILFGAVYIVFGFLLVRAGRQVGRDQGGPRR